MKNPILEKLITKSNFELCTLFAHTETMPVTNELAEVRGAIMDALEVRNPVAFDAWMDDYTAAPHKYFN